MVDKDIAEKSDIYTDAEAEAAAPVQSVNSQTGDVSVASGGVIPSSQTVTSYSDLPLTDLSEAEIWFVTGEDDIVASTQLSPVEWRSLSDFTAVSSLIPDENLLQARWDATELSGYADGDVVSKWADETGNGYNLNADGNPSYQTDILNGNPIIRGDGTDDRYSVSYGETVAQPHYIFVVAQGRSLSASSADRLIGTPNSGNRHDISSNTDGDWRVFAGNGVDDGADDNNPHIFGLKPDGANGVFRIDGSDALPGDFGTDDSNGMQVFDTLSLGNYGSFDVGEILHYYDTPNVSDVESYLSNKWGITLA